MLAKAQEPAWKRAFRNIPFIGMMNTPIATYDNSNSTFTWYTKFTALVLFLTMLGCIGSTAFTEIGAISNLFLEETGTAINP